MGSSGGKGAGSGGSWGLGGEGRPEGLLGHGEKLGLYSKWDGEPRRVLNRAKIKKCDFSSKTITLVQSFSAGSYWHSGWDNT